jgi:hypothetical protein
MSRNPYSHYNLNLTFQGKTWNRITSVFVKEGNTEEQIVIASEHALYYHTVKYSLICNSFDHNAKLSCHIFSDLKVGSKHPVEEQKLMP